MIEGVHHQEHNLNIIDPPSWEHAWPSLHWRQSERHNCWIYRVHDPDQIRTNRLCLSKHWWLGFRQNKILKYNSSWVSYHPLYHENNEWMEEECIKNMIWTWWIRHTSSEDGDYPSLHWRQCELHNCWRCLVHESLRETAASTSAPHCLTALVWLQQDLQPWL